jgi:predicted AAA+ superfamily ATPase
MLIIPREKQKEFLDANGIRPSWKERDFVSSVKGYLDSSLSKVLLISGLRGTGKTVGILQAILGRDAVYITMEKAVPDTSKDLLGVIKDRPERILVIDEYTWIEDRKALDAFLPSLVSRGKRVILTGTESMSLEAMRADSLIHRSFVLHTTFFSFSEYRRLYGLPDSQEVLDRYLISGGIFEEYVTANTAGMEDYIKASIIDNIKRYIADYSAHSLSETAISNIVYTLFYRAIWDLLKDDSKLLKVPTDKASMDALEYFGVDLSGERLNTREVTLVADLLVNAGVLIKVPNFTNKLGCTEDFRTYITNTSLTAQLVKAMFPGYKLERNYLGILYEASCMVDLYHHKEETDALYFLETRTAENCEIDILLVADDDMPKKRFYLFECKHARDINIYNENWSLVNGRADELLFSAFPDSEIAGRILIHPGEESIQTHKSGREVFLVRGSEKLYSYKELCAKEERERD